jgi:hypothetical protein
MQKSHTSILAPLVSHLPLCSLVILGHIKCLVSSLYILQYCEKFLQAESDLSINYACL